MKTKLLSLLLVITLLAVTISTGLPTILAADENLITNGDFADYSGGTPTGWNPSFHSTSGGTISVVEDVQITDSLKANAVKLTTTGNTTNKNHFYYSSKIEIEKNASYTMSFWVKVKNIKGFTTYMYEPDYKDKNGAQKTNWTPVDGQNIYSYSSDNGSTRVIRTDIEHSWTIAESGVKIDGSKVSMAISRTQGENQVLTPDYPKTERMGEWLQVIHEFSTGNYNEHTADITYSFSFPSAAGGEIWIADVKMNVKKAEIGGYFTPEHDETLGIVTEDALLISGKPTEITAEPFGENIFEGWFVEEELISKEKTFTFTYDPANPPKYEARFKKAEFGIDGSFETGYSDGQLLAQTVHTINANRSGTEWTENIWLTTNKDGSNEYFMDSFYAGDFDYTRYRKKLHTSTNYAHTGEYSLAFWGANSYMGKKFTGLTPNTDYRISFYATLKDSTADTFGNIKVTTTNISPLTTNGDERASNDPGMLFYAEDTYTNYDSWGKITIQFNTKNNTEVMFWLFHTTKGIVYIDNISISRAPALLKPKANDINLGFTTPVEGIECRPGDEVNVIATPLDGNSFEGWYIGDNLVSDAANFTFNYTNDYKDLTAHFKAGDTAVTNAGFETGYTNGMTLAERPNVDYDTQNTNNKWKNDLYKSSSKDGNNLFFIDSEFAQHGKATITNEQAHTGSYSVKMSTNSRYIGYRISGLKKNTNYDVSFYAMTKETTADGLTIGSVIVTDADTSCMMMGDTKITARNKQTGALGAASPSVDVRDSWKKIAVNFTTAYNTDIIVWVRSEKANTIMYLDNFAIYEPCYASISAGLGGSVSSDLDSDVIVKGSDIKIKATPVVGNTFIGWFDADGTLVSDKAEFTFTVNESFAYIAKFEGPNMPPSEQLSLQGIDGSFESYPSGAAIPNWFGIETSRKTQLSWATFTVMDLTADSAAKTPKYPNTKPYEGDKVLNVFCRNNNTLMNIDKLDVNSNYRLSFYAFQPDPDIAKAYIENIAIIGGNDIDLKNKIYVSAGRGATNSGWNRVDMYFNSGDSNSVRLYLRYMESGTGIGENLRFFIDNMELYQYQATENLTNGDFEDGITKWIGDANVVADGENKLLSLNKDDSSYNNVIVKPYSSYTISFKAKGRLNAGAIDLGATKANSKNYLSSVSCVEIDNSAEWNEYSYNVYTNVHQAINIAFTALSDGAMVDDVKITKNDKVAGSVIEHIDFESDRFQLTKSTDTNSYSIYYAENENDPYVYSGRKSLKFTYNELLKNTERVFNEAYLSYQPGKGNSIKVSMKVKIADGKNGGYVGIAPEYTGTYGVDSGFEHMSKTDDWQNIVFYFNNSTYAFLKAKINSVIGSTTGDFYVDDIFIEITPPMVMEENSKVTYCERLYNAVDNESFESAATNKDWANLPSTVKIVKGKALKGDYFLRAKGGTHYVLPITIQPNKEHYFGVSIRGSANTVGSIGITLDNKGTEYYSNRDGEIASVINFDSKQTDWKRSGFRFTTDSDVAYLTIDVKSGALEIDSVMLFTSEYGYSYDPNDYTKYVPYDYDNIKSASTVINGGFGKQPYYKGTMGEDGTLIYEDSVIEDENSPSTGDSLTLPVIAIVLAFVTTVVLMVLRKRKEGAENAQQ